VRERLRGAPDGPVPVVHRGRDAVYVDVAGRCVGVVTPRATAVPCALRTRLPHLDVTAARIAGGVLHLDDVPLVVGRMVDVRVPRLPHAGAGPATEPATLPGTEPPPPGDVATMVGRGDGLTPYEDDVLCGWLAVHRAAGVPTPTADAAVRAHLDRTTLLSATLLECATRGEVVPEFAAWVRTLGTPAEPPAAARLAAIGHTSGAGMLHGARLALSALPLKGAA
jgi:hypothetical protein